LDGANLAKSIEKGAKIAEDLTKALASDDGWADDMTIVLARMKIRNPAMSYTEMALATGLSRDVVSGRIQRLIRRNNERVS
jgi:DNA-binding transcriptional regulator WhiA